MTTIHITAGSMGNGVQGNFIGTDATGRFGIEQTQAFVADEFGGVIIEAGASQNTIGGTAVGARNVISGNGSGNLFINGTGATGNIVQGNFIGPDVTGTIALGVRFEGVGISLAPGNLIGGTADGAGNLI